MTVTPAWLREQGDACAQRAVSYVDSGGGFGAEVSQMYAQLARDWFAAAAQAYSAAFELDIELDDDG